MSNIQNPAGRLHSILSEASVLPQNMKVREVWSNVFKIQKSNDSEIIERLLEIHSLFTEVRRLIQLDTSINQALYLSSFEKIQKAIFPVNLETNWLQYKNHLDAEILTRLEFCAEHLTKMYSEETVSKEELKEIKSTIESLFEMVSQSQIETAFRLVLLEEIERIRSSISLYNIHGAKGVKQALQATIGAFIANAEEIKNSKSEDKEVINRLCALLDKVDKFTSMALNMKKIISKPVSQSIGFVMNKLLETTEEIEVELIESEEAV